jgi:hypothetical protein
MTAVREFRTAIPSGHGPPRSRVLALLRGRRRGAELSAGGARGGPVTGGVQRSDPPARGPGGRAALPAQHPAGVADGGGRAAVAPGAAGVARGPPLPRGRRSAATGLRADGGDALRAGPLLADGGAGRARAGASRSRPAPALRRQRRAHSPGPRRRYRRGGVERPPGHARSALRAPAPRGLRAGGRGRIAGEARSTRRRRRRPAHAHRLSPRPAALSLLPRRGPRARAGRSPGSATSAPSRRSGSG